MNELQIFTYNGNEVRTVQHNGETWWVLKDVCEVLELSNPSKVAERLEDDERSNFKLGRQGEAIIVNESGLYNVILRSDKPEAKPFRKWVTSEVLPSIRRTGTYSLPKTTAGQIQLLAQGYTELEQKIDDVNNDLQEFKQEMPLLAIECQKITEAKNKKIVPLLGGKDSVAYHNASLRGQVYRDLEGQLRREFGVTSYKAIKRNQTEKAVEIIRNYELPLCLKDKVINENAQINFS